MGYEEIQGGTQNNLAAYFDKSATVVRQHADHYEHTYARPVLKWANEIFEARPLSIIFLSIFAALSLLPVAAFIGVSLSVFATFIFAALSSALVVALAVEVVLVSILVSVLSLTFLLALFLSASAAAMFLFVRFVLLVRQDGQGGVKDWASETKGRIFAAKKGTTGSNDSAESLVVIKDGIHEMSIPLPNPSPAKIDAE